MIRNAQSRMPTIRKKIVPRLWATAVRLLVYVMAACRPSIAAKWHKSRKSIRKNTRFSPLSIPQERHRDRR